MPDDKTDCVGPLWSTAAVALASPFARPRPSVRPSVLRHLSPSLVDDACIACNRRAETFFNWTLGAIG